MVRHYLHIWFCLIDDKSNSFLTIVYKQSKMLQSITIYEELFP